MIFWVIQGHTKYHKEISHVFNKMRNVIWCTESDAPEYDLAVIQAAGINTVLIDRVEPGFGRINIHSKSATAGLLKAKEMGATTVIKLRSDLHISDTRLFEQILKHDGRLYGHCYVKHGGRFVDHIMLTEATDTWLSQFGTKVVDKCCQNYITDWIHYGPIDEMLLYYRDVLLDNINQPVICEVRFNTSYLLNKGLNVDFTYDYLTKHIGIFMKDLYNNGIDVYSLKEKMSYTRMWHPSEPKSLPENFLL